MIKLIWKEKNVKDNVAKEKSIKFSIRIINLYKYLTEEKKEYVISKQLLRCGTSIGSNIAESECAMSSKDFLAKIYIALKESNETLYWLELLYETQYINEKEYCSVKNDCTELKRILMATTKTMCGTDEYDEP